MTISSTLHRDFSSLEWCLERSQQLYPYLPNVSQSRPFLGLLVYMLRHLVMPRQKLLLPNSTSLFKKISTDNCSSPRRTIFVASSILAFLCILQSLHVFMYVLKPLDIASSMSLRGLRLDFGILAFQMKNDDKMCDSNLRE